MNGTVPVQSLFVANPGGKVKVIENPHRVAGLGQGILHHVVEADIAMVNPTNPEPA